MYVFTSNESEGEVFFDNFGVTGITGSVLEESHYYPFGLVMDGIGTVAPLKIANQFKFNDIELNNKEFEVGFGLETYTATYRSYDPQLGRCGKYYP